MQDLLRILRKKKIDSQTYELHKFAMHYDYTNKWMTYGNRNEIVHCHYQIETGNCKSRQNSFLLTSSNDGRNFTELHLTTSILLLFYENGKNPKLLTRYIDNNRNITAQNGFPYFINVFHPF